MPRGKAGATERADLRPVSDVKGQWPCWEATLEPAQSVLTAIPPGDTAVARGPQTLRPHPCKWPRWELRPLCPWGGTQLKVPGQAQPGQCTPPLRLS